MDIQEETIVGMPICTGHETFAQVQSFPAASAVRRRNHPAHLE
jgi:hypothetical protein